MTKQQLIDLLGIVDGNIAGLWNLNGNFNDLSSNGYNLTASGSPTDNNDGMMAQAKTFASASSQYAKIANASCANLNLTGSQTWFALVNPSAFSTNGRIMSKTDATNTAKRKELYILASSDGNNPYKIQFELDGLTTNNVVYSNQKLSANKWYLVVGVYDSTNSKLKVWVNGIKTEVTASGTAQSSTSDFRIGAAGFGGGNTESDFFNGTIQCAGVLSVALSDSQVQRL